MRRSFLHFIIYLFASSFSFGQDTVLATDTLNIEEVLIQATRSSPSDPVSFQNIGFDEIDRVHTGQDPAVLLQELSPSIVSYSDAGTAIGNYAQFRMRGISQSRINVTLNGVPLNDMIDQGVFFSNFSDFGNSLQSIQIQRGVTASNVGVASYGGAVNFESPNIFGPDEGAELQLTTGSFGTLRTSAEIKTGLRPNKIGAYGRISRTNSQGYKDHSGSDAYSIFGSIGLLNDRDVLKMTAFMGKTQNDQSYLPVLADDIISHPTTNYNHPNDTDDFEQELVQLQYSNAISETTTLDATLYYGGARGIFPFGIDDQTQFVFGLTNDHYGFLSHVQFAKKHITLSGGIQGYQFDRTNYEYIAPDVTHPYNRDQTQKREASLFGKIKYDLNRISLFGDVQFRSVDLNLIPDSELGTGLDLESNWFFANYVAGINFQWSDDHSIYMSYGKTSREPTRTDIYNGVMVEEQVHDLEIGFRMRQDKLDFQANLFHMNFDNEISQVGALVDRSYMEIRKNMPESRRSGAEIVARYQPNQQWSLTFNGAFLQTNVTSFSNGTDEFKNVQHIFAPKWVVTPGVQIKISETIGLQMKGRHVSSSFMELSNNPAFMLPAHTVLHTQLNISFHEQIDVKLLLNNLFNQRYYTDGAPVDLDFDGLVEGPGYRIQPPRHIYLMVTLHL